MRIFHAPHSTLIFNLPLSFIFLSHLQTCHIIVIDIVERKFLHLFLCDVYMYFVVNTSTAIFYSLSRTYVCYNPINGRYFATILSNTGCIQSSGRPGLWSLICSKWGFFQTGAILFRGIVSRADSRFAPSQWETSLQSNAVSHWLGANLESAWFLSSDYRSSIKCARPQLGGGYFITFTVKPRPVSYTIHMYTYNTHIYIDNQGTYNLLRKKVIHNLFPAEPDCYD